MELGLGVFTERTTRYYPMDVIRELGALIDRIDGRSVLIFMDATFTPAALFVDATTATVREREVHLDTGGVVRSGFLFDAANTRLDAERPPQMFTRWYGFALTFQEPEIFGQ